MVFSFFKIKIITPHYKMPYLCAIIFSKVCHDERCWKIKEILGHTSKENGTRPGAGWRGRDGVRGVVQHSAERGGEG